MSVAPSTTYRDSATGISVERKEHDPPVYIINKAGTMLRFTERQAEVVAELLGRLLGDIPLA